MIAVRENQHTGITWGDPKRVISYYYIVHICSLILSEPTFKNIIVLVDWSNS